MTPKDPYKYFRIEAGELVDGLRQGALDLEKGSSAEVVARLMRLAHTLKGAARVVKLGGIAERAHAVEDLLEPYRSAAAAPSSAVDAVLREVDAIAASLVELSTPASPAAPSAKAADAVRVDLDELDRLIADLAEASARLAPLQNAGAALERLSRLAAGASAHDTHATQSIEDLQAEIDELRRALPTAIVHLGLDLAQARDAAARLRLLPASRIFSTAERAARDAAQELGKSVRFIASGGGTRLDAHVLESVGEALLHVVRNAVAHGIRSRGTVTLSVVRSARRVAFVCSDDGGGLDVAGLREAAIAGGAPPDAVASDEGVIARLLAGGLSTAKSVNAVAGRGVGLDVVREIVARLRGEVIATSRAGIGTTFEIRVPVSLTSLEALVVSAGGLTGSIPLDAVRGTARIVPADVLRRAGGDVIAFEGQTIPFASLARVLRREDVAPPGAARIAVIVTCDGGAAALAVDALDGTREVVVQPLPPTLDADATVVGASLGLDGDPQLAFDPDSLVQAVRAAGPEPTIDVARPRPLLVVDDSLTTRMLEQSILESAGYEVDVASSAEEALEKARRRSYGAFVVDVEMPGMDGFTFVAATRSDPVLRATPAILVTSRDSPDDRARGRVVGAFSYIVKGEFDQAVLLQNVREILG